MAIKWCVKRDVYVLTSNHDDSLVTTKKKDKKTGEFIQKPKCIVEYNKFMGLMDKMDMQLSFTESYRKTIKWYKKVVFHMFEMMMYNAYILFKISKNERNLHFRTFRKNVILEIINKYGLHRKRKPKVKKPIEDDRRLVERHFPSVIDVEKDNRKKNGKCFVHNKTSQTQSK